MKEFPEKKWNLRFETEVPVKLEEVKARFNIKLFEFLKPAFPKVVLDKYEGENPGNEVLIRILFFGFTWHWDCIISQNGTNEYSYFFEDEGIRLPPFLSWWRHKHELVRTKTGTLIVDDITFIPGGIWPGFLVKFLLWMQFRERDQLYKKYFSS
jgi:ligand-binding SRPBCC domain-containing protein